MKDIKRLEKFFILDMAISILVIIFFFLFNPAYVLMVSFFFALAYLFVTKRSNMVSYLGISFIVAFIWMLIAKDQYNYNHMFPIIAGINLFPLFGWTIGLIFSYILFTQANNFIQAPSTSTRFFLYCLIFWSFLIFAEYLGYHVLGIQDLATATYTGLPLCNCMHAPTWMKFGYFLLGPIYFSMVLLYKKHFKK